MRGVMATLVVALVGCNNPAQEGAQKYFDAALAKNQESELNAAAQSITPVIQCQSLLRDIEGLRTNPDYKLVGEALTRIKAAAKEQGCMQ